MIPFATIKEEERDLIDLAFAKKKSDERKEWLRQLEVCCCGPSDESEAEPSI